MESREFARIDPEKKKVIERFMTEVPVKLGDLARELGISSIKISSMNTGVSGQIKNESGQYVIRVNRNESRERQRFTIAHEIAHFLLHQKLIDILPEGITDNVLYRSGAPERVEYEANRLAADLVMPMSLVEQRLREDFSRIVTDATIESLAKAFGVSKAAMEIRLSAFADA